MNLRAFMSPDPARARLRIALHAASGVSILARIRACAHSPIGQRCSAPAQPRAVSRPE